MSDAQKAVDEEHKKVEELQAQVEELRYTVKKKGEECKKISIKKYCVLARAITPWLLASFVCSTCRGKTMNLEIAKFFESLQDFAIFDYTSTAATERTRLASSQGVRARARDRSLTTSMYEHM